MLSIDFDAIFQDIMNKNRIVVKLIQIQKIDIFGVEDIPYVSVSKEYTLSDILDDSPDADYTHSP